MNGAILKLAFGAGLAAFLGLNGWMLDGQARLGIAVGELRGEIQVLNITLQSMDARQGHYVDLAVRVGALERAGR